jgi:uncharacterized protein
MALTAVGMAGVAVFGLTVGVFSALLGVGGGLLMVPFMVLVLDVSQRAAEGSSLLVIVPTAAVGVMAHSRKGFVSFPSAGYLALGGVLGSYLGASLALELRGGHLEAVFGAFTCLIGIRFVYQGVRKSS